MSQPQEEVNKTLKDDSQAGADLKVKINFDRNSCISISFPELEQTEQENPISEVFLDYFDGIISILIYRADDEDPRKIYIAENRQRKKT